MTPSSPGTRGPLPGTRLLAFARLWFDERTIGGVFEPLVADWQRQWNDAPAAHRRWVSARGFVAFVTTAAIMTPRLALVRGSFRPRPLVVAGSFWFGTAAMFLLFFFIGQGVPFDSLWLLLPASLTMMLPFAILPAIDAMRRDDEEPTAGDRRSALVLVVVAVCGVAIGQGWLTPVANQHWRNVMWSEINGRPMTATRGVRELTTPELISGHGTSIPVLSETERVREINMRVTLAALPAVVAWLRWRSLSGGRKRSWPVTKSCFMAIGATVAFFAAMPASPLLERLFLAPGFGPLLALAALAITTRVAIWWRVQNERRV